MEIVRICLNRTSIRPQVFSTSRRFLLFGDSRVCFNSVALVGLASFRGFPLWLPTWAGSFTKCSLSSSSQPLLIRLSLSIALLSKINGSVMLGSRALSLVSKPDVLFRGCLPLLMFTPLCCHSLLRELGILASFNFRGLSFQRVRSATSYCV